MLFNRMFRERALRRRARQEPLDDRLQITAPHEWLIVAGLTAMLLALIVYAVLARVEFAKSYEAALVLPGERHYLVASVSGTVLDVFVEETDTVAPGQPIANLQTSAEAQHWESVIVGIIDAMRESGQLTDGYQGELLQALLDAREDAESTYEAEFVSPYAGEVVALDLAPGQAVFAGDSVGLVRSDSAGQPEVVAFVSPNDAARLRTGMEARVSVDIPGDGAAQVFPGQVTDVTSRLDTPPQWLSERGLDMPQQPHQLRVSLLGDAQDIPMVDGLGVSLRVVLGRESLASLLAPGGG